MKRTMDVRVMNASAGMFMLLSLVQYVSGVAAALTFALALAFFCFTGRLDESTLCLMCAGISVTAYSLKHVLYNLASQLGKATGGKLV